MPFHREARQPFLAGEQFLHGALFDVALLGDELLQGFDERIRIAQRLGDGFLFGLWTVAESSILPSRLHVRYSATLVVRSNSTKLLEGLGRI